MATYLTFGKGPDLILGHGMAQNKNSWIETGWVEKLSSIRTVHVFDFIGHGINAVSYTHLTLPTIYSV